MKKEPSYYGIIPAPVRYDNELPPRAKILYSEITALSNTKGFCYASNGYFAKLYDVNKGSISRLISKLEKRKHVNVIITKTEEGTERKIYPIDKKEQGGTQKCVGGDTKTLNGLDKKEYHNTKENNKVNNLEKQVKDLLEQNKKLSSKLGQKPETTPFDEFWEIYDHKKSKSVSLKAWKKITDKEKALALEAVPQYLVYIRKNNVSQCHASTWLNQKRWDDDNTIKPAIAKSATTPLPQRYSKYLAKNIESKILRVDKDKYEALYQLAAQSTTAAQLDTLKAKLNGITNPYFNDCFVFDVCFGTLAKKAGTQPDRRIGEFKTFYGKLSDYNQNKGELRPLFKKHLIKKFG